MRPAACHLLATALVGTELHIFCVHQELGLIKTPTSVLGGALTSCDLTDINRAVFFVFFSPLITLLVA
jgi:hypothetical protein